jgi:ornithine carbamoyltransferase
MQESAFLKMQMKYRTPDSVRHLVTIGDLDRNEICDILTLAVDIKDVGKSSGLMGLDKTYGRALHDYTLLTFFEKPSLRTRVSLEAGMHQMGGHAIFYSLADSPLGVKESIEDTAMVLSRICDGITARVASRETVKSLAKAASIPVINALDDYAHPMQMLADIMTIFEKKRKVSDFDLAYFGDLANNVTYDLMRLSTIMGFNLRLAGVGEVPESVWEECREIKTEALKVGKARFQDITVCEDAASAMNGADVVYCDSWMSYGIPKDEEAERTAKFMPYQVTADLMKLAKPDCIFMNCLPAARGMEQTAEVIDGPQSVVFDQAENRLHAQKALLIYLLRKPMFEDLRGRITGVNRVVI